VKRVLFYFEDNWVFGKIFREAAKYLYPEYDCDLLDWSKGYDAETIAGLQQKYDLFCSTPVGCFFLHDAYGIPLHKCYGHAHSDFDLVDALRRFPKRYFGELRGFGAVSPYIIERAQFRNIAREPAWLPVGVTTQNYQRPAPTTVRTLGYFGKMARVDDHDDIKRGYLAKRVAEMVPLALYHREHVHFLAADRLYQHVDLVIFCSTTEGNPYVVLEAAAAGLPVLGTAVGLFPEHCQRGAGILLPTPDDLFTTRAVMAIRALQNEPARYDQMRQAALTAAQCYDWSAVLPHWRQEFSACVPR
jgi:glycosyltransferase involved in cell wall biosynthesis